MSAKMEGEKKVCRNLKGNEALGRSIRFNVVECEDGTGSTKLDKRGAGQAKQLGIFRGVVVVYNVQCVT